MQWTVEQFGENAGWILTEAELRRIRDLRAELFSKVGAVALGDALELEFAQPRYAETPSSRPI